MRDRPRYDNSSAQGPPGFRHEAPQYPPSRPPPGEAPPRVYHPDGGPWEGRPPYNAGPYGRSEQRDSRLDEPQQHGGRRPGMPPRGPVLQEILSRPSLPHMHRAEELYGSGGLQAPIMPDDGSTPNILQRWAPEPPQGVMPYSAPREGTQESFTQGRPQFGPHEAPQGVMLPLDGTQLLPTLGRPQQRASEPPQGVMPYNTPQDGNRAQTSGRPYNRATEPPQDVMSYDTPRDSYQQAPTSGRPLPHNRAPDPLQGVIPYDAPRDGSPQALIPGRPQPVISTYAHENVSGNRRESQDGIHRPTRHKDVYRSGERHDHRGEPENLSDERHDPMYTESPLSMGEHSDRYYRGGPSRFRDSDPTPYLYPSSHFSGGPPTGFQHERSNLQLAYQNEEAQPGASRAGMYNVNPPPVPDTLHYRAPSPGIQQYSMQPTQDPPQQGHYPLPQIQGHLPSSSYAFHPPVGTFFSGSLEEGDLEVPRLYGSHPPHLPQDRRQGPDPLTSSGMVAESHLEHDVLFPQHEVLDGRMDPNLLLQHGSPFVSQPTPHMEDSFLHLDTPTDLEKVGSVDKEYFVQWLNGFLSHPRKKPPTKPETVEGYSVAEARELIYGALRLVTQLESLCQTLESRDKKGEPWTKDYEKAADIQEDLEGRLKKLERPGYIQGVKRKLERLRKKRLRSQRRRQAGEEEKVAAERSAEKEASIDLWRMQCIQQVEEKKRERELKAAADQVLGEVRKKKNDVKKMLDVLKSLEKLRKLRKEAAGRKGVCPPPSSDVTFTNHINRLRTMVHKRSALYDAEEKTLRVILEGEQEEERQRDNDKRLKKLKEKMLQKQRELDDSLFGDTEPLPSLHPLQPFRQYYLQAEHSVVSLVQIRHEWDQFLVPPDHPDGSSIPRGWVVPAPPSNDTWATALNQLD
ncbi:programmed cell death protein 7 [Eleutherodactylus coqui]|uniref:programmed cell death protein 7 n=1 Tax=Eleutherodactylus coqui TaxID=57060 RepID=UPI00346297D6